MDQYILTDESDGTVRVLIPPNHPYYAQFEATIVETGDKWAVRYRDFSTQKQSDEFDTYDDAYKHMSLLKIGPHYVFITSADELRSYDKFWRTGT